jgi:hypothetical protein
MGIAFWYSRIFWNKIIFKAKHVFIRVLNNLINSLTMIQTYLHSCFPFPDFFVQVIFFCNDVWITFKLTLNKLWHHWWHIELPLTLHGQKKSYKWGRQLKGWSKNYRLQGISQCVQIWIFIFNKNNDFVKQTKMNQVKFSPSSSWIH